jgi:hypothetical protein
MITHKSARWREPGLLDEGEPQILRYAQDLVSRPKSSFAALRMTGRTPLLSSSRTGEGEVDDTGATSIPSSLQTDTIEL